MGCWTVLAERRAKDLVLTDHRGCVELRIGTRLRSLHSDAHYRERSLHPKPVPFFASERLRSLAKDGASLGEPRVDLIRRRDVDALEWVALSYGVIHMRDNERLQRLRIPSSC